MSWLRSNQSWGKDYLGDKASKTGSKYLWQAFQHLGNKVDCTLRKLKPDYYTKRLRTIKIILVDKITVNNTDITNMQEISDDPRPRLGLWIAKLQRQWTLWTSEIAECLFRLFDPSNSHMEEEISTTGPTDVEESLILTSWISLWKSNSVPKTSRSLNTVRHHASWIYASTSIFRHTSQSSI